MMHHIREFSIGVGLICFFFLFGCNQTSISKSKINVAEASSFPTEEKMEKAVQDTIWKVISFERDSRYDTSYNVSYASEFSKYFKISFHQDTLIINSCRIPVYNYEFNTSTGRYDEESIFTSYYTPQKEKVSFITAMGSDKDLPCFPLDNLLFYKVSPTQLMFHDRGYFFLMEAGLADALHSDSTFTVLEGTPGNNRMDWSVTVKDDKINSLGTALKTFQSLFPYGAEAVIIPEEEGQTLDKKHLISYKKKSNTLLITKSDPMGEIEIEFKNVQSKDAEIKYNFSLPEY